MPHILHAVIYSSLNSFLPNSKLDDCLEDCSKFISDQPDFESELTDDEVVESEPVWDVSYNAYYMPPGAELPTPDKHTYIHNCDYTVLYPYDARLHDELTIRPGDAITVEEGDNEEDSLWWMGTNKDGHKGYFYSKFTQRDTLCHALEESGEFESEKDSIQHSVTFKETTYYVDEKPGEELECIICKNLADGPHQTGCCGHTVCYNCADKWRRRNNSCPNCRLSPLDLVKDPRTKRHISSLTVYCVHYQSGCEWKGSVNNVSNHLHTKCRYEIVLCKKEGCGAQVQRQFLDNHMTTKCPMRQVQCPCCACADEPALTYHTLVNNHYKHCPDWPMRCPNYCSTEVKLTRSTLQGHLEDNCPEQVISCQFAEVGCTVRVERKEMADHIQQSVGEHMTAMMSDYMRLKKDHTELRTDHRDLKKEHIELLESHVELTKKHDALTKDHFTLDNKYMSLKKDHTELQADHRDLKKKHIELLESHVELTKKHDALKRDQFALDNKYSALVEHGTLKADHRFPKKAQDPFNMGWYTSAKQKKSYY